MEKIEKLYEQLYTLCKSENIELDIQIKVFPFYTGSCTVTKKIMKGINGVK